MMRLIEDGFEDLTCEFCISNILNIYFTPSGRRIMIMSAVGNKMACYEYLEKEEIDLECGVSGIVMEKSRQFEPQFNGSIIAGVVLCIAAVIPVIVAGGMDAGDFICIMMVCYFCGGRCRM